MPNSIATLEDEKAALLRKISQLADFWPGSVTATTSRCGNPRCHRHGAPHALSPSVSVTRRARDGDALLTVIEPEVLFLTVAVSSALVLPTITLPAALLTVHSP
jgi:hypothetical protein